MTGLGCTCARARLKWFNSDQTMPGIVFVSTSVTKVIDSALTAKCCKKMVCISASPVHVNSHSDRRARLNMYIDPGRSCRCPPHQCTTARRRCGYVVDMTTEWVGGWGVCMSVWVGVGATRTVSCEYELVAVLGCTCAHARLKCFNSDRT